MLTGEMDPPILESVYHTQTNVWLIGRKRVLTFTTGEVPENATLSWPDRNGHFYVRRFRVGTEQLVRSTKVKPDIAYHGGEAAAIWKLGPNYLVKVKAWVPGMEEESKCIDFIKENCPNIKLPEVVTGWVEKSLNRSFLIMKRVEGRTLRSAWNELRVKQRENVAKQVAQVVMDLTDHDHDRFASPGGLGVQDQYLQTEADASHPSWKARPVGPFTREEFWEHVKHLEVDLYEVRAAPLFLLYHADLNPGNIMVDDAGNVCAIIDWESLAFYPYDWITEKIRISDGFFLDLAEKKGSGWKYAFSEALRRRRFVSKLAGMASPTSSEEFGWCNEHPNTSEEDSEDETNEDDVCDEDDADEHGNDQGDEHADGEDAMPGVEVAGQADCKENTPL